MEKIRLGISSCLVGMRVRYDGNHALDRFLTDTLGRYVTYVPVCPEVECGLPVPREPMRLEGDPAAPRLVTVHSRQDLTDQLCSWALRRVEELASEDLCGFIFKARSPSSGMERVKVYDERGVARRIGSGLFAATFMRRFPLLPVEEEGRLHDMKLRESFVERIFTLKRWRELLAFGLRSGALGRLVEFHARHKLLLLSHSPGHLREMGRLIARGRELTPAALFDRYQELLMQAMRLQATRAKNTNVLQHATGYLRKHLSDDERHELRDLIEVYLAGHVPLIVPLVLVQHHVRKHQPAYLASQVYLDPHPLELQLRNHP